MTQTGTITHILYISAATSWMEEASLREILAASRKNNQQNGITGLLLFDNKNFVQLLEGEHNAVQQTFDRIKSDPRHSDVTIISSGSLPERCFPSWQMGFKAVGSENKQALQDFIEASQTNFERNDCEYPVRMLQAFLRKMI